MKVAIPLYKERVAPHFGSSSEILLIEIKGPSEFREAVIDLEVKSPFEMARRLLDLGVTKIVCGGISKIHKGWLIQRGISVEDNRKGEAKEILKEIVEKQGRP